MFEDACPYSKRCSSSALLLGSVLGSGKDLEVRFLHHSEVKLKENNIGSATISFEALFNDFDAAIDGLVEDPDGTS